MDSKISIKMWLTGLVVFLAVIAVTNMVEQGDVTLGIIDHQAAGTAQRVDEIQTQWRENGVRNLAIIAVIADLAWIWIYALGSFLAGRGFATRRQGALRAMGLLICASAIVFGITDYTETTLQFIQLFNDKGNDAMAGIAATVQPIKVAAFIVSFAGIIIALVVDRFGSKASR